MEERELRLRLNRSIAWLFRRDLFLLEHQVGERVIVAKLACYMSMSFRDYHVDVEYNRQGLDPADFKFLDNLPAECNEGGDGRVYPDIIVHRRGDLTDDNLLVVEVKRSANRQSRVCDRAKIDAMKAKFSYSFGVFIEIPTGPGANPGGVILEWH